MGGALLSFATMAVSVRELSSAMSSLEILFLRSVVSFLLVLAFLPRFGAHSLRTRLIGVHFARNLTHLFGQYAWISAIAVLPLATVFAIEFTMPVWTALLAVPLLAERMNRGRVVMLVLGLAGVAIILKPGAAPVHPAALLMLGGSFAFACTMIATKRLAAEESTFTVLFHMQAIQLPLGFLLAIPVWVTPGPGDWPTIAAIGCAGLTAHLCVTRALRIADATLVVPIDFLRLPLITGVGIALYGEPLDWSVLAGAVIIFAGTWYSIRRESRNKRAGAKQKA